jgi:AcrR family transcriptional regulator
MPSQIQTPWNRDTDAKPSGLSREAIVTAAVAIADEEGIEAVSIRRIATKLEARPMSLYSHIEHKDELVDLMMDEVIGETILPGELPTDWRQALREIALRTRATARAHPWTIGSALKRRLIGPNTLRHFDQSLGAIASLDLPFERKRAIQLALDTYTLGYVRWEVFAPNAGAGAGDERLPTQEQVDSYLREQVAGGDYPHLAAFTADELALGVKPESFEAGLEWLLAGIAAEVEGCA